MSYDAIKTTTIRNADLSMTITGDPKLTLTEIAKGMRDAIKQAVKLGILPKATYAVRQHNSRTSQSVSIEATGLPFNILSRERIADDMAGKTATIPWMSLNATFVYDLLERIGGAWQWNCHEQSNYHLSVAVGSSEPRDEERARIMREIESDRLEAREQAARAEDREAPFQVRFF